MNRERQSRGLATLVIDERLQEAARAPQRAHGRRRGDRP